MSEIVETGADGFTVTCADGRMKILRVQPPMVRKSRPAISPAK
jgi:hypothetical protein